MINPYFYSQILTLLNLLTFDPAVQAHIATDLFIFSTRYVPAGNDAGSCIGYC
jgi:hypothetical protein